MRNLKITALAILVVASISLGSCKSPSGDDPDFVGTWQAPYGLGQTKTLTFTKTAIHMNDTAPGTIDFSITSYDESAGHILTAVTGATGSYAAAVVGTVYYWLYSVSGNQMRNNGDTVDYPVVFAVDVYTKQ